MANRSLEARLDRIEKILGEGNGPSFFFDWGDDREEAERKLAEFIEENGEPDFCFIGVMNEED